MFQRILYMLYGFFSRRGALSLALVGVTSKLLIDSGLIVLTYILIEEKFDISAVLFVIILTSSAVCSLLSFVGLLGL